MVDKRILNTLRKCLKIRKNDKVLILTDTNKLEVSKKFEKAARALSNNVLLMIMKPTGQHGREPLKRIAKEMLRHDVIIAVTRWSLTHTHARKHATRNGARIASLPNFTEKMIPALGVDYEKMEKINKKLENILRKGNNVRITTPYGSDMSFSIKNRKKIYTESYKSKDVFNIPLGEVAIAPRNANGVLVFNSYQDLIKKPTKILIKKNRAVWFENTREGRIIKKILSVNKGKVVAEFGIGTNYKARHIHNILLDEKVVGTCHIAFGSNISFGGRNKSSVHIDVVLFKPIIKIDDRIIMKNGRLQ